MRRLLERVFDQALVADGQVARGSPRTPPRARRPTSSASATGAWRRPPRRRRPAAARGGPRRSSTPARRRRVRRATGRSRAGRAGPRLPPSRMAAAIARASSSVAGGASSTLNATSGGRAATSAAPAVGCEPGGPKSGRSSPVGHARARARPGRRGAARRACGRRPARRTGRRAARARWPSSVGEHERLGHRRAALLRRRGSTIGATSIAPDVRVDAARGSRRSIGATAWRAPADERAGASRPGAPASVNTERWWSGSEWTSSTRAPARANAAPIASIDARSRPSETLGTASSVTRRSQRAVAAGVEHRACPPMVSVASVTTHVEVDRDRRPSRRCRRWRRRRRGRCRASSRPRGSSPVSRRARWCRRRARRGSCRARRARRSVASTRAPSAARAIVERAALDRQDGGLARPGRSAARLEATICPSPPIGAMKPSPHGQVAERARRGQVAVVGDARAAGEVERRSVPRGQVTCAWSAALEQRRRRLASGGQRVEVGGHQAREHVAR